MWSIIEDVLGWLATGEEVAVARVVGLEGAGGRREGESLALGPHGARAGSILGGIADRAILGAAVDLQGAACIEVEVGDREAVAAGLACGGLARVLVQDAALVPGSFWEALAGRTPVALATVVTSAGGEPGAPMAGESIAVSIPGAGEPGGSGSAGRIGGGSTGRLGGDDGLVAEVLAAAGKLLSDGRAARSWLERPEGSVLVEAFVPATRLVVVGRGSMIGALAAQSRLLGWEFAGTAEVAEAEDAVSRLGAADAVVVLDHDHDIATPVLGRALARGCYVGALGSRHTQAERRRRLLAAGVGEAEVERVHGPVGLDLGSRTPEETALAICAEVLAHRSGRDAASLRSGSGPING